MKCSLCGQESEFYNVDINGLLHCPKCGGVEMTDEDFTVAWNRMLNRKQFMKEVDSYYSDI